MMRCLAACTASRPNSSNGTSSSSMSPTWKSGSSYRASSSGDLPARVFHRLHHLAEPDDADGALQLVHAQLELDVRAELADQRGLDAVAQQLQQIGALELFGGGQLAERGQHLGRTCHVSLLQGIGRARRAARDRAAAPVHRDQRRAR